MSSSSNSPHSNSDFFLKEFPAVTRRKNMKRQKRSHVFPNFRWTHDTTIALLESVTQELKYFEQPTARVYYMNLIRKYHKLSSLDWNKIKHKMRNLRVQYTKASKWQLENCSPEGEGEGEALDENMMQKNILKICPLWSYCDQIFKHKLTNIDLSDQIYKENCKSNDSSVTSFDFTLNEYKKPKNTRMTKKVKSRNLKRPKVESDTDAVVNDIGAEVDALLIESESCAPFENHFIKPERVANSIKNSYLQEKRSEVDIEFEREKLQLQRESLRLEHEKLQVEKCKIELEKHKIDVDFRLRQEQIASDERIRKYEIEFKYKS